MAPRDPDSVGLGGQGPVMHTFPANQVVGGPHPAQRGTVGSCLALSHPGSRVQALDCSVPGPGDP